MRVEIRSLTGIRGIAALYVVFYHYTRQFPLTGLPLLSRLIEHGYLSVDLFFLLSGFVLSYSAGKGFLVGVTVREYLRFMQRRFARIYPIYILLTIFYFAALFKFKGIYLFLINALLLQIFNHGEYIITPSWSLSSEWIIYFAFPFLFYFLSRLPWRALAPVSLIISWSILGYVSWATGPFVDRLGHQHFIHGPLDAYIGLPALLKCLAEYIVGIFIFLLFSRHSYDLSKMSLYVSLFVLLTLMIPGADLLIVALFSFLIVSLARDTGPVAKWLSSRPVYFLGEISYSMYLLHDILIVVQKRMSDVLSKHEILNSYWLNGIIFGILLLTFSFFGYRLIERPCRTWIIQWGISLPWHSVATRGLKKADKIVN